MPTNISNRSLLNMTLLVALAVAPALAASTQSDLPDAATADWWRQVQHSIQLEQYAAAGGPGETEFRAVNPAHPYEARFDTNGVRVVPADESDWSWGRTRTG